MKTIDRYHKWVEWSDEDGVYIGRCPDLITGVHGDDPVQVYKELCEVIADVIDDFRTRGRPLPDPRVRPVFASEMTTTLLYENAGPDRVLSPIDHSWDTFFLKGTAATDDARIRRGDQGPPEQREPLA